MRTAGVFGVVLCGWMVGVSSGRPLSGGSVQITEKGKGEEEKPGAGGGDVTGQAFGPTSVSWSTGWWEEDLPAWGDLPDSRFVEVPDWLVGVTSAVPSHLLKEQSTIIYHCPKASSVRGYVLEVCEAFVFLFRCPPCVTERGNLEQQLLADGWSLSSCGPKFKTGFNMGNGYSHRMMVLRKQFPADSSISFVTPDVVIDYIAFGLSTFGVECEARATADTCNAASAANFGACTWDFSHSSCVHTNYCPRLSGPHGPGGPGCQVCPSDEIPDFIP